jgi:hypothetical protein
MMKLYADAGAPGQADPTSVNMADFAKAKGPKIEEVD